MKPYLALWQNYLHPKALKMGFKKLKIRVSRIIWMTPNEVWRIWLRTPVYNFSFGDKKRQLRTLPDQGFELEHSTVPDAGRNRSTRSGLGLSSGSGSFHLFAGSFSFLIIRMIIKLNYSIFKNLLFWKTVYKNVTLYFPLSHFLVHFT